MPVPLLDPCRQNLPLEEELMDACRRVLHSGQFILGREVERFEQAAAAVAGTRFAIGVSSGTDAILAALMALGIGPGDEVICPAMTFFATAGCIARVGAKPVFADSLAACGNMDPAHVESLIGPRTRAIIPVHLFGQMADMDALLAISRRHHLPVIEDAAQAFGAQYRNHPAGSMAEFGIFSFFPSKNLGALGDAGLLVTNDASLADKAISLRNHGARQQYYHSEVGGNFRLDALHAALLMVKLPHLAEYTKRRQCNALFYDRTLAEMGSSGTIELLPPRRYADRVHIINQYTLRVRPAGGWAQPEFPRDALRRFLQHKEIASAIYYPVPLHRQECFRPFGPYPDLPVAEALAKEVLSIPVFPELTEEERRTVVEAIAEFEAATQNTRAS